MSISGSDYIVIPLEEYRRLLESSVRLDILEELKPKGMTLIEVLTSGFSVDAGSIPEAPPGKKRSETDDLPIAEIRQLRKDGWTYDSLGAKYGRSQDEIADALRRTGPRAVREASQ